MLAPMGSSPHHLFPAQIFQVGSANFPQPVEGHTGILSPFHGPHTPFCHCPPKLSHGLDKPPWPGPTSLGGGGLHVSCTFLCFIFTSHLANHDTDNVAIVNTPTEHIHSPKFIIPIFNVPPSLYFALASNWSLVDERGMPNKFRRISSFFSRSSLIISFLLYTPP